KAGLHAPDRQQRPRWHAVALLDRGEQRALRMLELPSLGDDGGGAALGEEGFEREIEAALAAVGIDGGLRVIRCHQGRNGGGADALGPRLARKLLLPAFIAGGGIAAGGGVGVRRERCDGQGSEGGRDKCLALGHLKELPLRSCPPCNSLA